jgi:AhpD family alkylhydroperoxidase
MRASQINTCAYCLHMHAADARKAGESEAKLYLLSAWEESELYTPRERAALSWTEALTRLSDGAPSDADFAELREHFNEVECVNLSVAIGAINMWNRINCGFQDPASAGPQPARSRMTARPHSLSSNAFEQHRPFLTGWPTACSARSAMPRTWCRMPGCAGTRPNTKTY